MDVRKARATDRPTGQNTENDRTLTLLLQPAKPFGLSLPFNLFTHCLNVNKVDINLKKRLIVNINVAATFA